MRETAFHRQRGEIRPPLASAVTSASLTRPRRKKPPGKLRKAKRPSEAPFLRRLEGITPRVTRGLN